MVKYLPEKFAGKIKKIIPNTISADKILKFTKKYIENNPDKLLNIIVIYKLDKGFKNIAFGLMLDRIEIQQQKLILHLSFWKLTMKLFYFDFAIAVVVVVSTVAIKKL